MRVVCSAVALSAPVQRRPVVFAPNSRCGRTSALKTQASSQYVSTVDSSNAPRRAWPSVNEPATHIRRRARLTEVTCSATSRTTSEFDARGLGYNYVIREIRWVRGSYDLQEATDECGWL